MFHSRLWNNFFPNKTQKPRKNDLKLENILVNLLRETKRACTSNFNENCVSLDKTFWKTQKQPPEVFC